MSGSTKKESYERFLVLIAAIFISSFSVSSTFRLGHAFHKTATLWDDGGHHHSGALLASVSTRKPRILLGINCIYPYSKQEGKRRRMVRQSYLQFHHTFNLRINQDNNNRSITEHYRICSIPELMDASSASSAKDPNDCRIVYTFIFPNRHKRTDPYNMSQNNHRNSTAETEGNEEKDVVHFRVSRITDSMEHFMVWMKFANRLQDGIQDGSLGTQFDYVGFASAEALVYPTFFWEDNPIFQDYKPSVFAGMKNNWNNATCDTQFCWSHHFLCLSEDLSKFFSTQEGAGKFRKQPMNAFHPYVWNRVELYQNETGKQVSWLKIEGVDTYSDPPEEVVPRWDKYMSSVATTSGDAKHSNQGPMMLDESPHASITSYNGKARILVGIFCTDLDQLEKRRRQMLRNTYLSAYEKRKTKHRICSLQSLIQKQIAPETCQFAYTFVVGGNRTTVNTGLVDTDDIHSIIIPHDKIENSEPDVLYLNIKENMNKGKSETWFRYASLLIEHEMYFDYVAKMDTDTILFPRPFFEVDMSTWPKFPENVRIYGGEYNLKQDGTNRTDLLVGTSYFNGPFYWMSPDIARFITDSTKCNRTALRTSAEDMTIGNYINSYPHTIHRYQLSRESYAHPFKDIPAFRKRYGRYKRRGK